MMREGDLQHGGELGTITTADIDVAEGDFRPTRNTAFRRDYGGVRARLKNLLCVPRPYAAWANFYLVENCIK